MGLENIAVKCSWAGVAVSGLSVMVAAAGGGGFLCGATAWETSSQNCSRVTKKCQQSSRT